ncbi:beta-phosphoglucomutase family hydrolase [Caldovatus aquaticus]|uniref:Beta-phosphoglucomutase n=1 Tax=Caldovatus aquaticus TaxID=2865671 RepID=A0ABS7F4E7_9PROT|nr:beta-phosphoglucomutase family hydrolase [Caldovatus aquaticus]MBW8270492.1 beta-phosphoglucomutase family hydrolase [Caldovatus aquaticus]
MAERSPTRLVLSRRDRDAALFDLDGVLTDTARLHAAAWKTLFDEVLRRHAAATGAPFRPFDAIADYRAFVDGRPREDGVRSFLAARGIVLPEGTDSDPPEALTVAALARRKQALFLAALRREGVAPAPGAAALLAALRRAGIAAAVVSASRNGAEVLAAAGLERLVDLCLDGRDAAALGLPGKPAPDTFLEAARRLGGAPARCVVFEDAPAGVEAARRGGFGLIVGVDRDGQAAAMLRGAGAHAVIRTLAEVAVAA